MKILIISHYPPIKGGISNYTIRTVNLLRQNNVETSILPVESFGSTLHILHSALKNKPDLIRLEYAISMYRLASISVFFQLLLIKMLTSIVLVANFHEVRRDTQILGTVGKWFYTIISKLFSLIFVHTREAENVLLHECHVNKTKVVVIPHGLYLPSNLIKKTETKKKRTILFFGYIHIHKGIEYLLDAYARLIQDKEFKDETELVIAGTVRQRDGLFKMFQKLDDNYLIKLSNKVKILGIEKQTKFLGFVEERELNTVISNATMVVLPYTATEQSGVLNQILPYQIPIIATNIGGLGETLKDAGELVKPKDAEAITKTMKKLLTDNDYYKQIQNKYAALNNDLDPAKLIKEQINYYQKLVEEKKK